MEASGDIAMGVYWYWLAMVHVLFMVMVGACVGSPVCSSSSSLAGRGRGVAGE